MHNFYAQNFEIQCLHFGENRSYAYNTILNQNQPIGILPTGLFPWQPTENSNALVFFHIFVDNLANFDDRNSKPVPNT